jgi:lipopolysaccharide transport system ATP-binding protein
MKTLLEVNNISKSFVFYDSSLRKLLSILFGIPKPKYINVLDNISFNLNETKSIGIVGLNGCGKSTLLKIISGVLKPSLGSFKLNGSVISILELGMGLNSEFTGRENVYLALSLNGLRNDEIESLIPEIFKFSELGDYFDRPIKIYSSGMYLRLAFSIATAKKADLVIIDEALSVGDASFQYKCFSRLNSYKKQGTSFLIVSHDKNTILQLCDDVLLIDKGKQIFFGNPMIAYDIYNAKLSEKQKNVSINIETKNQKKFATIESGNKLAEMFDIRLINPSNDISYGSPIKIKLKLLCKKNFNQLLLGVGIKDMKGTLITGTNTDYLSKNLKKLKKNCTYCLTINFKNIFNEGYYVLQLAVQGENNHTEENIHWIDNAIDFTSINKKKKFVGFVDSNININLESF